jgi:predicted nucleic acid binding AN1-type Zn finger protein
MGVLKCECCSKRINPITLLKCSYCKTNYCITCRIPEIHSCPNLNDCKFAVRSNLTNELNNNTAIPLKIIKL